MTRKRDTLGWIGLMVAIARAADGEAEKEAFRLGQAVRKRFFRLERHDAHSRELIRMVAEAARKEATPRRRSTRGRRTGSR